MNTKVWPVDRTAGQLMGRALGGCQLAVSRPPTDAAAEAAIVSIVTTVTTGTRTRPSRAASGRRTGILSEQSGIDPVAVGRPGCLVQDSTAVAHPLAVPACPEMSETMAERMRHQPILSETSSITPAYWSPLMI